MKSMSLLALLLLIGLPFAAATGQSSNPQTKATHRYLVERTFPSGALDNLDAATRKKIIANNDKAHVHWLKSYVNLERNRTYCIYEGPSKDAVRKAAALNDLPVDSITEIPATLVP